METLQNSYNKETILKPVKWERKQPASARMLALMHYIKVYYSATIDRKNNKMYVSYAYIRDVNENERSLLKAFNDEFGKIVDIIFV